MTDPDPLPDGAVRIRKTAGAIANFLGTFLASAGIAYSMFALIEEFAPHKRNTPPGALLAVSVIVALAGFGLCVIGRALRPGLVLPIGRVLTVVAVLWIATAGTCFDPADDEMGLQRAVIALGSLVAALVAAIGQTIRE